jgi:hypothetical protein
LLQEAAAIEVIVVSLHHFGPVTRL